jgi:hypothetical protein
MASVCRVRPPRHQMQLIRLLTDHCQPASAQPAARTRVGPRLVIDRETSGEAGKPRTPIKRH